MKPSLEAIGSSGLHSFLVRQFAEKGFRAPYHFHPEFELTFILRGSGKRYVGTKMADFGAGDFVLLGANLPHCWKTEAKKAAAKPSSIVVQFKENFLGNDFFEKPEMKPLRQLLQRSGGGIRFTSDTALYRSQMQEILHEPNSFKKVTLLLELLHRLSLSKKYEVLEKQRGAAEASSAGQQRLHAVTAYIVEHFKEAVSLSKAASLANMTPPAFCKYFKRATRKTFVQAVTDYRIDYAAQQLVYTHHSVSQISFDSGFNDLSHFHKSFRARMQLSPLRYRNAFLQKLR